MAGIRLHRYQKESLAAVLVLVLFGIPQCCVSFLMPTTSKNCGSVSTLSRKFTVDALKLARTSGQGFGKKTEAQTSAPKTSPPPSTGLAPEESERGAPLQSIEGGSTATPVVASRATDSDEPVDAAAAEQRAKQLLKEKFGLKSLEQQLAESKEMESINEQQRRLAAWKKKLEKEEDFDIMRALPAPVLIAIDRFLKIGLGLSGVLFIFAGIAITLEAWSKTTGNALPEKLDAFIVSTVEPNFTLGLVILLSFSVSLGLFAAAQMGSQGAQYREE